MAYIDQYTLANDATFKNRLQPALVNAANQIAAEVKTTHNRLDEKRHALTTRVLQDGGTSMLSAVAMAVCAGQAWTTAAPPTDAQIDTQLASVWNNIAGVSNAELTS